MLRFLKSRTMRWASSRHAPVALGAVSFVESSVFPVPADILFVPMCLARPTHIWRYAFWASVTSVLGGILGWLIGFYAFDLIARPVLEFYGKYEAFLVFQAHTGKEAVLPLLISSGFSHIPPMKIVTIFSGLVKFDLTLFIISAIIARGGRFYLLAWLLGRYGERIVIVLERHAKWIAAGICAALCLVWAVLWALS